MSVNDYIKFMTEQIVHRIDQPKFNKKLTKDEHKRLPWYVQAFGLVPLSIFMFAKRKNRS